MGGTRGRRVRVDLWPPSTAPNGDVAAALSSLFEAADIVWLERGAAPTGDVLVIPPGAAGAAPDPDQGRAAFEALRAFTRAGGTVLGLDDGVALLCAAQLLPGAVTPATSDDAAPTHVRVEGRATRFTWAIPAGRVVPMPDARRAHRYGAPDIDVAALTARGQVLLRYCDVEGGLGAAPHGGQAARVAGLCDETGRVVGVFGRLSSPTQAFQSGLVRQMIECFVRAQP